MNTKKILFDEDIKYFIRLLLYFLVFLAGWLIGIWQQGNIAGRSIGG